MGSKYIYFDLFTTVKTLLFWPLLLCNLCDSREGSMLKEGSMFTTNTVKTSYDLDDEDHPVYFFFNPARISKLDIYFIILSGLRIHILICTINMEVIL